MITLYRVADLRGSLTAPFSGAGIGAGALLDTRRNAANSQALAVYAVQHLYKRTKRSPMILPVIMEV